MEVSKAGSTKLFEFLGSEVLLTRLVGDWVFPGLLEPHYWRCWVLKAFPDILVSGSFEDLVSQAFLSNTVRDFGLRKHGRDVGCSEPFSEILVIRPFENLGSQMRVYTVRAFGSSS